MEKFDVDYSRIRAYSQNTFISLDEEYKDFSMMLVKLNLEIAKQKVINKKR